MNLFLKKTWLTGMAACIFISLPVIADIKKDSSTTDADLASLDNQFHQFSTRFYPKLIHFDKYSKTDSINSLVQSIDKFRNQNQPILATATVIENLDLVERHIDTTPIIKINEILLESNEWNTASRLYSKLKTRADKSLVSNVSLSMAEYYFSRNQWNKTIEIIESIRGDLPPEDYHRTLLMHGIALQRLQKHRPALLQYANIPKTSQYYAAARLNMAVADIRQDWWTDAHIIINDLINDKDRNGNSAFTDRLYTVLGYSLLQQQYFRNSRDAFRNVSLDGPYTNKALLGIALSAAYQEDYIGALNAIKILKDKKNHDLPVDEANLLMPYFYEKLQQHTTASAGYGQAIKYYENRISSIHNVAPTDSDYFIKQLTTSNSNSVTINGEIVELGDKLPKFFFENVQMLARFQPFLSRIGDATLLNEYNAMTAEYNNFLRRISQAFLNEKASYLTHYMNQSRYGLARMQDNDATIPR